MRAAGNGNADMPRNQGCQAYFFVGEDAVLRRCGSQIARLISAAVAATIPITEAVAAPVQKPLAQSSAWRPTEAVLSANPRWRIGGERPDVLLSSG
jgi:hypothetical protein